jgi:hypothetical protein
MARTTRQQIRAEYDAAWGHAQRQYYIQCAEKSIRLAPLPEFRVALNALKIYDHVPSEQHKTEPRRAYRRLQLGRGTPARDYGYSAVGEFYYGLCCILHASLVGRMCSSGDTYRFVEAHWCAARVIKTKMWGPYVAEEAAKKWHSDIHSTVWDEFYLKYSGGDRKLYIAQRMKEAA